MIRLLSLIALLSPVALTAQTAPALALTRDLRIDARSADLSPVTWLTASRTGVIAVGQPQDHLIRFFDPSGKSLGTFGREGSGPGEFRGLDRAGWIGDTMWVVDGALRRFTLVTPERKLLRNVPVALAIKSPGDSTASATVTGAVALYSDGSQLLHAMVSADPQHRPAWARDDEHTDSRLVVVAVTAQSGLKRLVSFGPRDDCGMVMMVAYKFCGHARVGVAPSGQHLAWAAASVAGADSGTYRVTLFGPDGKVFSRKYPFVAQPIPAHLRDSLVELGRSQPVPAVPPSMLPRIGPPGVYPPVEAVIVANDGTTWVALRPTAAGNPWVILSPRGDVVGTLLAPLNVNLLLPGPMTVWGTEKDADDLESVVRFRVVRH